MGKSTISMAIFYVANCNIFFPEGKHIIIFPMIFPLYYHKKKQTFSSWIPYFWWQNHHEITRCPASCRIPQVPSDFTPAGRVAPVLESLRKLQLLEAQIIADLPVNFEEMQNSGNGYYTINDNHISIEMIPFWSLIDIYRYLSINNNNVQW